MKNLSKQYYVNFGRLFVLLLLALCLFDFGVQAVAADNSVEASASVIESSVIESSDFEAVVNDDLFYDTVDFDSDDDGDDANDDKDDKSGFIKWLIDKYLRWFSPLKSGYGWSD